MASDLHNASRRASHSELRRALRDLSEAMPALFGMDSSKPTLVGELLKSRDAERPAKNGAAARRRPTRPRNAAHLVLVK